MIIKKRIGKDLNILWKVIPSDGTPLTDLEEENLKLIARDERFNRYEIPITSVDEDGVHATFAGERQKCLGKYKLSLWYNYDGEDTTVCDRECAFVLVPTTELETGPEAHDDDIIVTTMVIEYGLLRLTELENDVEELQEEMEFEKNKMVCLEEDEFDALTVKDTNKYYFVYEE